MSPVVEKLNPRKPSALSMKRDAQRGDKRGRTVAINEITLDEVRNDAIKFGLATEVLYQMNGGKEASIGKTFHSSLRRTDSGSLHKLRRVRAFSPQEGCRL